MELFWQVTEKHQQVFIPVLTVTFRRVTKEHYVPTEADIKEAEEGGFEAPQEEDYFSSLKEDTITVPVSEGEWMSYELGAIYGAEMQLRQREVEVV